MQTYQVTVDENGTIRWHQNGVLHRTDGPAVELINGTKHWYQNDLLHRLDGPAVERTNGTVEYWIDGEKLSKDEFLARTQPKSLAEIEQLLGIKMNMQTYQVITHENGTIHEWADGTKFWYKNGLRHRLDGPAVEWADGRVEYWLEGKYLNKTEFLTRTQTKELTMAEIEHLLGYPVKVVK